MRAIWLLLLVVLSLLTPSAWGADAGLVGGIELNPDAPDYLGQAVHFVLYTLMLLVFGIIIAWSIWQVHQRNFKPILITFGAMLLMVLGILAFFGQGPGVAGYAGWNAGSDPSTTPYQWDTYGNIEGSPTHFASQAHAYEVQQGWAIAGAMYFYRIIDLGFRFHIIPLIGIASCLYAVWMSYKFESVRPILVHIIALAICVPVYLIPYVQYQTPADSNVMYTLLLQGSSDSGSAGSPPDAPRVTPFVAASFGMLTDLTTRIGERIAFGSRDPNTVILQAACDARLADGDYTDYMQFASFCMTSVHSAMSQRKTVDDKDEYHAFYQSLVGDATAPTPGGSVGNFNKAPISFRHALSPYSDAMFRDVWPHRWIYMYCGFEDQRIYDGTYAVNAFPEPYTFAPNPSIGAGFIEEVNVDENGHIISLKGKAKVLQQRDFHVHPTIANANEIATAYHFGGGVTYVPFCSIHGLRGDHNKYEDAASADLIPDSFKVLVPEGSDRVAWRPLGWDDTVRAGIARRYIGAESNAFCKGVSPDRQNEHLWGCLIAGKFRNDDTEQGKSMHTIQTYFDSKVRPLIQTAIDENTLKASTNGGVPAERASDDYWSAGDYELGRSQWNFGNFRNFCDTFMAAPGVASQVGLFGDFRAPDKESTTNSDNWFYWLLTSIGGALKPGVAGIFAWIATAFCKIAMMLYPHVLGIMTFVLMLKSVPYLVRGICVGQYLYPVFHLLPGIAIVALMPVFIQVGLSFIEQGNGTAIPQLFIRSQAGADFGESLFSMIGAFFILSSFSLSATFLTLGFGSIAGVLGSVNSTAFKLTGAGAAAVLTLASIAAAIGTKGASKMLGGLMGGPGGAAAGGAIAGGGGGGSGPAGGAAGALRNAATEVGAGVTATNPLAIGSPVAGRPGTDRMGRTGSAATVTREVTTRAQGPASREAGAGVGSHLIEAGSLGYEAAMAASSAVVATMAHGGEGEAMASGMGLGHSLGQRVGGAFLSAGRAVRGITNAAGRSYAEMRDDRGQILPSTPANDTASRDFSRVATTFEKEADAVAQAGDLAGAMDARRLAAGAYRDAGRLSTSPTIAATNQVRAAEAFTAVAAYDDAAVQIAAAEANYRRAGDRPASSMDAGHAAAGLAELRQLQLRHAQASSGGSLPPDTVRKYQTGVAQEAARAEFAFAKASESARDQALEKPSAPGAWTAYGAAAVARMRVAALAEETTGEKVTGAVLDRQTPDLQRGIARGDKEATVILAAMYAGTGNTSSAQALLQSTGIEMNDEALARLAKHVREGRVGALEALFRRL